MYVCMKMKYMKLKLLLSPCLHGRRWIMIRTKTKTDSWGFSLTQRNLHFSANEWALLTWSQQVFESLFSFTFDDLTESPLLQSFFNYSQPALIPLVYRDTKPLPRPTTRLLLNGSPFNKLSVRLVFLTHFFEKACFIIPYTYIGIHYSLKKSKYHSEYLVYGI
jgi:hypothetical protein